MAAKRKRLLRRAGSSAFVPGQFCSRCCSQQPPGPRARRILSGEPTVLPIAANTAPSRKYFWALELIFAAQKNIQYFQASLEIKLRLCAKLTAKIIVPYWKYLQIKCVNVQNIRNDEHSKTAKNETGSAAHMRMRDALMARKFRTRVAAAHAKNSQIIIQRRLKNGRVKEASGLIAEEKHGHLLQNNQIQKQKFSQLLTGAAASPALELRRRSIRQIMTAGPATYIPAMADIADTPRVTT